MKEPIGFEVTIVKDGKNIFQMSGYVTPLFALRDCLKKKGYLGAYA